MSAGYTIKTLEAVPFESIHAAMLEAFSDYPLDMSYMTLEVFRSRATKNGVDLSLSPGAFDGGRLVGLTLVGIGEWGGQPAAFDACTGIVKAHRGQGLAGKLFAAVLPSLKTRGIRRFVLEVLQENEAAIKAYERTGFRIARPFACYEHDGGDLPDTSAWEIRPIGGEQLAAFEQELDWAPSWENSFRALALIPDGVRLYGAFRDGQCVGLTAYYPMLRWVMMLVVRRAARCQGAGTALLAHAVSQASAGGRPVRLNNLDPSDLAMAAVAKRCGFRLFTSQYEMVYDLP